MAFGERSRYVTIMRPTMTNIGRNMFLHGEPDGLDAFTPLGELIGSITPSDLHYVSSHGSTPPDIDPRQHRLVISGMVERPLVFTMDELVRLPAVSRVHYIECVVNRPMPEAKTLEQMHGMCACSEWTGVPLAVLLNEVGVKAGANWVFAEGADAIRVGTTVPLGKAMDDVLVAYGQNGGAGTAAPGLPVAACGAWLSGQVSRQVAEADQAGEASPDVLLGKTPFHEVGRPTGGRGSWS
jgi:sulfane dehydrogenase subunit SoxC